MSGCRQCGSAFERNEGDEEFYERFAPTYAGKRYAIPPPTLCPLCRLQRRMIWRGELNLFKRPSAGDGKELISYFPPASKCRVLPSDEWWSDSWDERDYGRDFDFGRPFFDQFQELLQETPLLALAAQQLENSPYINNASWMKNCHLLAGANYDEDCYYGNYVNNSRSCLDNNFIDRCELCYECVDCTDCYNLRYSTNCHHSADSQFLYSCRGCRHCFGSVNLANKSYYFMNEPLSRSDYETRLAELALHTRSGVAAAGERAGAHRLRYPHRFMIGEMNENVSGNCIANSKNALDCFDVSDVEDCRYCRWLHSARNCMDIFAWGFAAELCYECMETGANSYHSLFSVTAWAAHEVLYSYHAMYSSHCFGCVSVRRKQHCILNRQYSPDEYERMAGRIVEHMRETGEWGEFFPMRICPLAYNTAVTNDYFPLEKEHVRQLGLLWQDYQPQHRAPATPVAIPDSIDDVAGPLAEQVLTCRESGRPFKLLRQELDFYKQHRIPVPDLSFPVRHKARLTRRNPPQLWDRACARCGAPIVTSYPPYRPEIVYCEQCYLAHVY